jgi:hypothetical protein
MFIDERNQLQFESIEELSANKEFAIKEIIDWQMPTTEEITKQLADTFSEMVNLGLWDSIDNITDGIALAISGFAYAQEIIDTSLQDEKASAKMKEYFERCTEACDLIIDKFKEN